MQQCTKQTKDELKLLHEHIDETAHKPLPPKKLIHTIDIHSSKVVIALVSSFFLLLCSIIGNGYELSQNLALRDTDIKYRHIKMTDGIDADNRYKLENIFNDESYREQQKIIRQRVNEYEERVAQRTAELERVRLKEAQAEQLRQEAEELKKKRSINMKEGVCPSFLIHLIHVFYQGLLHNASL